MAEDPLLGVGLHPRWIPRQRRVDRALAVFVTLVGTIVLLAGVVGLVSHLSS